MNRKKTVMASLGFLALGITPLFAQDPGSLVTSQIQIISGFAATIIPAGLLIWGSIWGVRKLKSMGSASS